MARVDSPHRRQTSRLRRAAGAAIAMLLATAALAGARPAPEAAAASPTDTVVVRLAIDAVDAINCFDATAGFGCGDADFYPVVHINNGPEQVGPTINDDNSARPTNWEFFSDPIPYAAGTAIPITIDIYDSDGGLRFDDDHADVSPTDGTRQLLVNATMGDVPCLVDLPTGAPDGTCGVRLDAWGFEGDEGAQVGFRVNLQGTAPDADGDGLADDWESNGVTFNGQFVDLPAMGADPNKPDLFIHLDWMADTMNNQSLFSTAIQRVVQAFANSGYVSPTGSVGINLWVDHGPASIRDFTTSATWGSLSRAQAIPWQRNLGAVDTTFFGYDWSAFQAIKDANFRPTGRGPIFHYAIAAFFQEAPEPGDPQNTSSGISRNAADGGFDDGASDFLITLGNFSGGAGNVQQQAGTLMHEFGHNLGLMHGGGDHENYKANYPSIMSYHWQMRGIPVNGPGGLATGVLDFSRGTLPAVDEHSLNEAGLGAAFAAFGTGSRCPVAATNPVQYTEQRSTNGNAAFDWNCNGVSTDGVVPFDANGSAATDASLVDHNDWANIKFRVGAIGDVGDGDLDLPLVSPAEPAVTTDNVPPVTTATLAGTLGQNGWYTSPVTVTLSATDTGGSGVASTEYRLGSGAWTAYTAPFVISGDAGHAVAFRSTDWAGNEEAVQSLTIRIDGTPPDVACSATPDRLWPPNHKLAAVATVVTVTDAGSGGAGFTLLSVVSSEPDNGTGDGDTPGDISAFTVGTADTTGLLRAERAGTGAGRVYTLTYEGSDAAGNTATCSTTVTVRR